MNKSTHIIRNASFRDAPTIRTLLGCLGYQTSISLLISQIENLFVSQEHQVIVYEIDKEIVGFISVHYLPQLGNEGLMGLITYLSVDENLKDHGIDKAMENFVAEQALKRRCDRLQVHCVDWRVPHHQFYEQQGYQEYPKFFTKRLNQ